MSDSRGIKPDYFMLTIDEKVNDTLNLLFSAAISRPGDYEQFKEKLEEDGLLDTWWEFLDTMSNHSHERGWCKDVNCLKK